MDEDAPAHLLFSTATISIAGEHDALNFPGKGLLTRYESHELLEVEQSVCEHFDPPLRQSVATFAPSTFTTFTTTARRRTHSRSQSDTRSLIVSRSLTNSIGGSYHQTSAARNKALLAQRVHPLMALVSAAQRGDDTLGSVDAALESPPELTSSRSSKSSSFRTSSSADGVASGPHDASNFEDITLDDLHASLSSSGVYSGAVDAPSVEHVSVNGGKDHLRDRHSPRPLPYSRSSVSSARNSISSTATLTGPGRDLTGGPRRDNGQLNRKASGPTGLNVRAAQSLLNLPGGMRSPRRGVTSPTRHAQPPFSPPLPSSNSSRSPSPNYFQNLGIPPHLPRRSSSRTSLRINSTIPPVGRRSSWQPGRKTVKELEDEYHDSDEDIPEDAVVWNVPLSPRPTESRSLPGQLQPNNSSHSVSSSSNTSLKPRRSQQDLQPQSGSIHALRRQRSTPAIVEDVEGTVLKHRSDPRPLPTHAATDTLVGRTSRTKSWTAALGDLSLEARELTAALEEFETEKTRDKQGLTIETTAVTDSPTSITPSTATPTPASATSTASAPNPHIRRMSSSGKPIVALPPVRKGDMLLDPLPISREKEKVLTRTRPSWLPPKSQKEEKRHLKEYKRMMVASLEAEKKRERRLQAEQEARDVQEASLLKIWEGTVLADWNEAMTEPRTRELWWRGVPAQHRGTVWSRAVGNELHLTEASYAAALGRAKEERSRLERLRGQLHENETLEPADEARLSQYDHLESDIRALSQNDGYHIFAPSAPLHSQLVDVLSAYASYRNDVGYVSGLHLPAALLLTTLIPPSEAFVILANILNRPTPMAYLLTALRHRHMGAYNPRAEPPAPIADIHALILRQLAYKLPSLHAHLTSPALGLRPGEYLDPLLSTLFCDPRVGVERGLRAWDVMAFEGDKVLVRAAVALLARLENRLYGSRAETLDLLGWDGRADWSAEIGSVEQWCSALREAGRAEREAQEDD